MVYIPNQDIMRWRAQAWRRQNRLCCHCGHPMMRRAVTTEHIIPVSLGGRDVEDNIAAACNPCNQRRSNSMSPIWFKYLPPEMKAAALAEYDRCLTMAMKARHSVRIAALAEFPF